jgi:hypothetical protein
MRTYGEQYKGYEDIRGGQINYYVDPDLQDSHFEPLFSKNVTVYGYDYIDPMGTVKPQYVRDTWVPCPTVTPPMPNSDYCLTSIRDSQEHREDMLSRQMARMNQNRYVSRHVDA